MPGHFVAYAKDGPEKIVCIGKVLNISKLEGSVVVHRYVPVVRGLRIHCCREFFENGQIVVGSGMRHS